MWISRNWAGYPMVVATGSWAGRQGSETSVRAAGGMPICTMPSIATRGWSTPRSWVMNARSTAAGFWLRANAFFTGIGVTVTGVMTDNGSCYRSHLFAAALGEENSATDAHVPIAPRRTARSNGSTAPCWRSGPTPPRIRVMRHGRPRIRSGSRLVQSPSPSHWHRWPHPRLTCAQPLWELHLAQFPVEPSVLSGWEVEQVIDTEFAEIAGCNLKRARAIRLSHEAMLNTGKTSPPNYIPPDPPVTDEERSSFNSFWLGRTQVYSCVLPGEIIRQCVMGMKAGTIEPPKIEHLIVDEYQDLNPMDIEFVDSIVEAGSKVFFAGDDDQSLYSFPDSQIHQEFKCFPRNFHHSLTTSFRTASDAHLKFL